MTLHKHLSQIRFIPSHNADFSNLPLELLQQIASYIAAPTEIERTGGRLCFAPELSIFRLICHAFARAGKLAMLSVMRKSNFTLYLPGTRNTLDDIGKVFLGTEFGQLISSVTVTMQPELDFSRLEEVIKYWCDIWRRSDHQFSTENEYHEARRSILEIHIKRCLAQTRLLAELKTVTGQDILASLLQGLPRVKGIGIQCADFIDQEIARDYFNGTESLTLQKPDLGSMPSHRHLAHCDIIPLLLPNLHHFTELTLDTDGSIFDRVTSTHIISRCLSNPLGGLLNSAFRLRKISISLTRQDVMLRYDTDTPSDLQGAAEFGSLLSLAVNLEDLSLRCPVGPMEGYVRQLEGRAYQGLGNASWLARVLQDQHWPKLKSVEIAKFDCDRDSIVTFLRRHRLTIVNADFRKCEIEFEPALFDVVKCLRNELNLESCSIGLEPGNGSEFSDELAKVFHSFKMPDGDRFDPDDPYEWNLELDNNQEDSEAETIAAQVLAHYILFDKPDWVAYAKMAGLQQEEQ